MAGLNGTVKIEFKKEQMDLMNDLNENIKKIVELFGIPESVVGKSESKPQMPKEPIIQEYVEMPVVDELINTNVR